MESQDKKIYKVVDIRSSIKNKYLKFLYSIIERPLEAFLGITDLNETYDRLVKKTSGNFFKRAVEAIGVDYEISKYFFTNSKIYGSHAALIIIIKCCAFEINNPEKPYNAPAIAAIT